MITKKNFRYKTMLTMYFREEEALSLIEVLNTAYKRYQFEVAKGPSETYVVYVKYNAGTKESIKDDILWFLLDRIAYGLGK